MEERPLLLSGAKTPVLVRQRAHPLRWLALALGVLAVLVGGADVLSRFSVGVLGDQVLFTAFAPAAALGDPSVLDTLNSSGAATQPLMPARLRIPKLGVSAEIDFVGKKADGSMGTPTTFSRVAWYKLGSKPGAPGNAVFAGHVNNALTSAGVFEHLSELSLGDMIEVEGTDGRKLTYMVREISTYQQGEAPLQSIFATEGPSQIALVTCDGDWDTTNHQFEKRLVVVARLE